MEKIKLHFIFLVFLPITVYAFSKAPSKPSFSEEHQRKKPDLPFALNNSKAKSFYISLIQKYPQISKKALVEVLTFYENNKVQLQKDDLCFSEDNKNNRTKIRNLSCVVVADYSKSKRKPRLLYFDPINKRSEIFYTAHGKGSNADHERETGEKAVQFSNLSGSYMTSLGYYLTDQLYTSKKDTFGPGPRNGLKLDGINCSNNQARKRYIVFHTAQYVPDLKDGPDEVGNSEGCITLPENRKDILKVCAGGALVYTYAEN